MGDYQTPFNIALVLAGFLSSYVLNSVRDSVRALQIADTGLATKLQAVELLVAGQYVRREHLEHIMAAHREDIGRTMNHFGVQLDRIESKLDGKVDK